MPITLETSPQRKTKNGKNVAQPRAIEVSLRFDVTGAGALTANRLVEIVNAIVKASTDEVTTRGIDVDGVEGEWSWIYGPWFKGQIS